MGIRCFISIDVEDDHIRSRIQELQGSLRATRADLNIVDMANIHVTLKFLGEVEKEKLREVESVLTGLKFAPFTLELRGIGAFPSLRRISIIWVGIGEGEAETGQIYEQVEEGLGRIGFKRESRPFSPHITVARVRTGRNREELGHLVQKAADLSFGSLKADRVKLKQSVLRPSGPQYSTIYEALGK